MDECINKPCQFLLKNEEKRINDIATQHINELIPLWTRLNRMKKDLNSKDRKITELIKNLDKIIQDISRISKKAKIVLSKRNIDEELFSIIKKVELSENEYDIKILYNNKLKFDYYTSYNILDFLENTLRNAVKKISNDGAIAVELKSKSLEKEEVIEVYISITDYGCKHDNLDSIFDFGPNHKCDKKDECGLKCAKRTLQILDGDIRRVDDDNGRAITTFVIALPIIPIKEGSHLEMNTIKLLHLSDLHIRPNTDLESILQPLFADLEDKEEGPGINELDYLIITGDLTNRATPKEFEKAVQFIRRIKDRYSLSDDHCIFVPGNHDLSWAKKVYDWQDKDDVDINTVEEDRWVQQGEGFLIRKDNIYAQRFKNFSECFYQPITHTSYPLTFEDQCIPFLFADHRILILAMNSSWRIDKYFNNRSDIHDGALARGLIRSDELIKEAKKDGKLPEDKPILKIAVWHHPVTGDEKIKNDAFLKKLQKADFKFCLHGHIHEERADLFGYFHPTRRIHISGAGSFDAPRSDRPESIPRLYNFLEIKPDLSLIRVHTRCKRKETGIFEGWAIWPGENFSKRTYYDINTK